MRHTIEISAHGKPVWVRWKKATGLSSAELFEKIIEAAQRQHQHALYLSLPVPSSCVRKPLRGKRLGKVVYKK